MGGRGGGSPSKREGDIYDYLVTRPWVIRRGLPNRGTVEDAVIRAFAQWNAGAVEGATDNVRISGLRRKMPGLSREAFDQALRNLAESGIAVLSGHDNLKDISSADRRNGIMVAGDMKHLISIGRK